MKRKQKIMLIAGITIFTIIIGFGSVALFFLAPAHWNSDEVEILLPVAEDDLQYVYHINGWGIKLDSSFHNGIDFDVNTSVEIIAWCDLRITGIGTHYNDVNGCWQTNVLCAFNWKYRFDVAFENWGTNETAAQMQKDALNVKVGQKISQGESFGTLLAFIDVTHLHFGLEEKGESVCPFNFMTASAQSTFTTLYSLYGNAGEDMCSD
jgi:murein DD-endopeptidase MepM/ murein hydrolase activator NlpD